MSAQIDDLPFAVSEIGLLHGEPVIVLPGGPCRSTEYLGDLAGLTKSHRLVVLHPRGTPRSGGLSRGWWTDADDVVALADALGLPRVNLLAHSAGTRLALAVVVRYPDRVRSLTLVTPPAAWLTGTPDDSETIVVDRSGPAVVEALTSLAHDDPDTEAKFRASFRRQAPASYARWTTAERAHAELGAVSLAAARAWFTDIPADAADKISAARMPPTLVLAGQNDVLTGIQPVVDYAALLGARLSSIERCGHYPWVEQPDAFRHAVDAWLTEGIETWS